MTYNQHLTLQQLRENMLKKLAGVNTKLNVMYNDPIYGCPSMTNRANSKELETERETLLHELAEFNRLRSKHL